MLKRSGPHPLQRPVVDWCIHDICACPVVETQTYRLILCHYEWIQKKKKNFPSFPARTSILKQSFDWYPICIFFRSQPLFLCNKNPLGVHPFSFSLYQYPWATTVSPTSSASFQTTKLWRSAMVRRGWMDPFRSALRGVLFRMDPVGAENGGVFSMHHKKGALQVPMTNELPFLPT